jgi:alpha/beta superfamily hydrolase
MSTRPLSEALTIPGPAGRLEAIVDSPPGADGTRVAVMCHPHPVYGGTMTNKVVHMLAKSCNEAGAIAVRFNFRGVGASEGMYDEGDGETQDTLSVLAWAAQRWPGAQLWLGGFSFGGAVAIRAASTASQGSRVVRRLITVAPAIRRVSVSPAALPTMPWLLVQGDKDELVDAADIERWATGLPHPPQLVVLSGVDHFYHGRLNDLRDAVVQWLTATAPAAAPEPRDSTRCSRPS